MSKSITLRSLIDLVFPNWHAAPVPSLTPHVVSDAHWQIVLRTATQAQPEQPRTLPPRKYLWVRRTSRRAYNNHMYKMRETLGDFKAMPALALFSSLVAIAFCLSFLMH